MPSPLPVPVGPLSERVITSLLDNVAPRPNVAVFASSDPVEHDLQLALYVLNELHYTGWAGVDDRLEWHPDVTTFRTRLEDEFERRLRLALPPREIANPLAEALRLLDGDGPSITAHLRDGGSMEQFRESMILRSPYQLKEADPHTFAIPRFRGSTKKVFTELQAGEYGVGYRRSHAELFEDALVALGLDPTPNAYVDRCTGPSLATPNLVTLGAMSRARRGIVLGQLSLFEMDSVTPNGVMVEVCERLGVDPAVLPFFKVHVLADAEHEVMVRSTFLIEYPTLEPDQVQNLLLGMRAQALIDAAQAELVVPAWERGDSALTALVPCVGAAAR